MLSVGLSPEIQAGYQDRKTSIDERSLAFTILIENMNDVMLLKECRLVCKLWNTAAANVLQEKTHVWLNEDHGSHLEEFLTLLANKAIGINASPTPFRKFHIQARTFSKDLFNRITCMPNILVERFNLELGDNPICQRELETFLRLKREQIKQLRIKDEGGRRFEETQVDDSLNLPALKRLTITDGCFGRCRHADLTRSLINGTHLERIKLVRKIRTAISDELAQQFATLFPRVSSTIEFFASDCIRVDQLPCCPKLKKLELIRSRYLEKNFVPHIGVTELRVLLLGCLISEKEDVAEEYLHIFWINISRQFPNAKRIFLDMKPFNHVTFRSVQQAFPNLKHLGFVNLASCGFTAISGMKLGLVKEYLDAGLSFDCIPRRDSIFNFAELESIILEDFVEITDDKIFYCFARIPTLKFLQFSWVSSCK
ncbi:unnamed protein product [Allacma fusca]|uniref:Uncharacterized protein n=1 Tax=Allacma fusca TaxID=39272 RepID=A0A8J2J9Q7_9HEXA|nr:unnamed protein product [Allacma fusca]